jgi:adenosylhomocysteine nucleosidase
VITGVVIALTEELGTLTEQKIGKGEIGHISDRVWLINSGAGAENAKKAAELLIAHGAGRLISWGCAAGLTDDLQPGALILADRCIAADNSVFETDKDWRECAAALLAEHAPVIRAMTESYSVIASSKDKLNLAHATQAVALDMESSAVAKVAKAKVVPFLVVRAIADPRDMDLPEAVRVAVGEDGQVDLVRLMRHLLRHPLELPALIRLGLHFKAAKNTLKKAGQVLDKLTEFDVKTA